MKHTNLMKSIAYSTLLLSLAATPVVFAQGMMPMQPTFEEIDINEDGFIDPDEFAQHQAEHMAQRADRMSQRGQGRMGMGQQGLAVPAVPFIDLDVDGDGCIRLEEYQGGE